MYCLRKRRKGEVCILFDFEGKNDLFHQLSHARNGKDHAFFMLGALLDKYNPLGKTYRVCDFINVIYSEHNKVCCSIVSRDNGFSSVELSLPENLFSLLLHIMEKTDSRISVNELLFSDSKENKIAVRLFYREDSFIIS